MRTKIGIGDEIDVVSTQELKDSLGTLLRQINDTKTPDDMRVQNVLQVDASGTIAGGANSQRATQELYVTPIGNRAQIMRVVTWVQGYTPATPLTAGYFAIHRGDGANVPELFFPGTGNVVAPATYEGGEDVGPRLGQGERLVVTGSGLPANIQINVLLTVRLWPDVMRTKFESDT